MRENKDSEKGDGDIEELGDLTEREVEEYRDANQREAHPDLERGEDNARGLETFRCTKLSDSFTLTVRYELPSASCWTVRICILTEIF